MENFEIVRQEVGKTAPALWNLRMRVMQQAAILGADFDAQTLIAVHAE